jgi:hypothetical protein
MPYPRIIILVFVSAFLGIASAQESASDIHQQTTPPPGARFEVIQSQLAAKWTFRLDRFTGHVAQLVKKTKTNDNKWEEMEILDLPLSSQANRPKFQIFTSGLAAKFTFLIDTDTGQTWVLVTSKEKDSNGEEYESNSWAPFAK